MNAIFDQISEEQFNQYFDSHRGNYEQTKEMAELKKNRNHEIFYVGVKNAENQILFASLLTRMKIRVGYVFEISGLIIPEDKGIFRTFIIGLKKFVKEHKGLSITIQPDSVHKIVTNEGDETLQNTNLIEELAKMNFTHESFSQGYNTHSNPNWIYVKDLRALTEENTQASYRKEARYSLKKAGEFGIEVRQLSYEELPIFKNITQETSERREFEDKTLDYYQTVFHSYGEKAKFLIAEINFDVYYDKLEEKKQELEGKLQVLEDQLLENPKSRKRANQHRELMDEVSTFSKRMREANEWREAEQESKVALACALFLVSKDETVYLFSGTKEQYKKLYAPFLIQDKMIRMSVKQRIAQFNFYGIEGVFDGSDGILKFKQAFNGYAVEKMGTFTCVVAPVKMQIYNFLKKISGR
jgi:alanine adding enzyme